MDHPEEVSLHSPSPHPWVEPSVMLEGKSHPSTSHCEKAQTKGGKDGDGNVGEGGTQGPLSARACAPKVSGEFRGSCDSLRASRQVHATRHDRFHYSTSFQVIKMYLCSLTQ